MLKCFNTAFIQKVNLIRLIYKLLKKYTRGHRWNRLQLENAKKRKLISGPKTDAFRNNKDIFLLLTITIN